MYEIARAASFLFKIPTKKIMGRGRDDRRVLDVRFLVCYVARTEYRHLYKDIGAAMDGRNHASIIHAVRAFQGLMDTDVNFRRMEQRLVDILRGNPLVRSVDAPAHTFVPLSVAMILAKYLALEAVREAVNKIRL